MTENLEQQDAGTPSTVTVEVKLYDGSVHRAERVDATTISAVAIGALLHDSTSTVEDLKEGGNIERSHDLTIKHEGGELVLPVKDVHTLTVLGEDGGVLWSVSSRARTVEGKSE